MKNFYANLLIIAISIATLLFFVPTTANSNPVTNPDRSELELENQLTGQISELGTGQRLAGATVYLKGSYIGTSTDMNGTFRLRNIPEGKHTLIISYLGYGTREVEVEISKGEIVNMDAELTEQFETLGEVVITKVMRGQSRAFNLQKEAENVKNIVSSQQIERFPDNKRNRSG